MQDKINNFLLLRTFHVADACGVFHDLDSSHIPRVRLSSDLSNLLHDLLSRWNTIFPKFEVYSKSELYHAVIKLPCNFETNISDIATSLSVFNTRVDSILEIVEMFGTDPKDDFYDQFIPQVSDLFGFKMPDYFCDVLVYHHCYKPKPLIFSEE